MLASGVNPSLLYLPLLNDPRANVRRQACAILLSTYGERGITLLRRLLTIPDNQIRQDTRTALQHIAEISRLPISAQPFDGIFVKCLGHTRLFVDDQEVRLDSWVRQERGQVGWQKVQGVLGYLVHCGARGTTRPALEAAIWGSSATTTSGHTLQALRQLLNTLRGEQFAELALTVADHYCLLRADLYQTDVQAFEQTFNLATDIEEREGLAVAAPLYIQALGLYSGPYLIDMPREAPWAQARRDHLRGNFLIAAERVAVHAYSEERYADCAAICGEVFDADESADDVVALLLRSYEQLKQRGLLEHTYRRYLTANGIDEQSAYGRQDVVVQTYRQLLQ